MDGRAREADGLASLAHLNMKFLYFKRPMPHLRIMIESCHCQEIFSMRDRKERSRSKVLAVALLWAIWPGRAYGQDPHGQAGREAIDRMRDRDLQPERILNVIGLREGMKAGEAGASYGYFTFKMSRRVGDSGMVYANDIDPKALSQIEERCAADRITNIKTVLGAVKDPLFPEKKLDLVVVFDCLFEFSEPAEWMRNARNYIRQGGHLVIVDPDPDKLGSKEHFLSRERIIAFALEAGYAPVKADDSFLKSHMIIMLQPVSQ